VHAETATVVPENEDLVVETTTLVPENVVLAENAMK